MAFQILIQLKQNKKIQPSHSVFKINCRPSYPNKLSNCYVFFNSLKLSVSAKCCWHFPLQQVLPKTQSLLQNLLKTLSHLTLELRDIRRTSLPLNSLTMGLKETVKSQVKPADITPGGSKLIKTKQIRPK